MLTSDTVLCRMGRTLRTTIWPPWRQVKIENWLEYGDYLLFYHSDVRSYVKEVIMNLVTVHAQVSSLPAVLHYSISLPWFCLKSLTCSSLVSFYYSLLFLRVASSFVLMAGVCSLWRVTNSSADSFIRCASWWILQADIFGPNIYFDRSRHGRSPAFLKI